MAKQQEILEERKHHMPTHPTSTKITKGENFGDNVKIAKRR
jgi:hypothetical protein